MGDLLALVVDAQLFGTLCLARSARGICRLDLGLTRDEWIARLQKAPQMGGRPPEDGSDDPALLEGASQIASYLAGERGGFELPLDLEAGTIFQQKVWRATARIPFGQVRSYGEVARQIGMPGGARAVGNALGRNPVPVIIPCHRVVRSDGQLGGFGLGSSTKRILLELEGLHLPGF